MTYQLMSMDMDPIEIYPIIPIKGGFFYAAWKRGWHIIWQLLASSAYGKRFYQLKTWKVMQSNVKQRFFQDKEGHVILQMETELAQNISNISFICVYKTI